MTSCTEPGETTGIAAATGSVIGAGVGAIVGNQTGHAGSGFVIGSVAGAGAGALVGNAFEAQEKVIRTQEEALKRQGRQIQEQQGQIEELRRLSQDNIAFRDSSAPAYSNNNFGNIPTYADNNINQPQKDYTYRGVINDYATRPQPTTNGSIADAAPTIDNSGVNNVNNSYQAEVPVVNVYQEQTKPVIQQAKNTRQNALSYGAFGTNTVQEETPKAAYDWQKNTIEESSDSIAFNANTDDCKEAEKEAANARSVSSLADRLFHYRRALRLCPNNPNYHNAMGEVYMSLQRTSDAEYEFREALKLAPNFAAANRNLKSLSTMGN